MKFYQTWQSGSEFFTLAGALLREIYKSQDQLIWHSRRERHNFAKIEQITFRNPTFLSYKIKIRIPQDAMCCERIQENVDKQGHLFGYL